MTLVRSRDGAWSDSQALDSQEKGKTIESQYSTFLTTDQWNVFTWLFTVSLVGLISGYLLVHFFPLPFSTCFPLSDLSCLHFFTDWLSRLGLGNNVGSTTDHLANCYLPSTPKDRSRMKEELIEVVGIRYLQSALELGITQTGPCES